MENKTLEEQSKELAVLIEQKDALMFCINSAKLTLEELKKKKDIILADIAEVENKNNINAIETKQVAEILSNKKQEIDSSNNQLIIITNKIHDATAELRDVQNGIEIAKKTKNENLAFYLKEEKTIQDEHNVLYKTIADQLDKINKELAELKSELSNTKDVYSKELLKLEDIEKNILLKKEESAFVQVNIKKSEKHLQEIEFRILGVSKRLEEKNKELNELVEQESTLLIRTDFIHQEIKELENKKEEIESGISDFIKKKIHLSDKEEELAQRESYLKDKFNKAGVPW